MHGNDDTAHRGLDVSGTVRIDDWSAVREAACAIFRRLYPGREPDLLARAYADIAALYRGEWPGYHACDMSYHDLGHVLDVSLAMARLLDGHERSHAGAARFGPRRALLGMLVSLAHDSGYIRRRGDRRHGRGAEYTPIHVSRSGRFLAAWLPVLGMSAEVPLARRLVQFTGYERDLGALRFADPQLRRLGQLIGSADLLAQMADPRYLDRCRDRLYPEFAAAGIARALDAGDRPTARYTDALDLLRKTPEFMRGALEQRLGGALGHAHAYASVHFGGRNPYLDGIQRNRALIERALARGDEAALLARFQGTPAG